MITWRRKGQPAPVFWPGQAHGQGSLVAAAHGPQSPSWNQHSAWKTQGSREVGLEMKAPSSHLFGAGFAACPSFLKDIFASRGFLLGSFFFLFSTLNISPSGLWVWWDPPIACGHFLLLLLRCCLWFLTIIIMCLGERLFKLHLFGDLWGLPTWMSKSLPHLGSSQPLFLYILSASSPSLLLGSNNLHTVPSNVLQGSHMLSSLFSLFSPYWIISEVLSSNSHSSVWTILMFRPSIKVLFFFFHFIHCILQLQDFLGSF